MSLIDFDYAAGGVVMVTAGSLCSWDSVVDWNHRRKCGTSYCTRMTSQDPCLGGQLDMLTAEIELAIEHSTRKEGMRPPGLLDVAMRHSVLPLGSSLILSTLT